MNVTSVTAGQTVWYMVYMQAGASSLMNVTEQRKYINNQTVISANCWIEDTTAHTIWFPASCNYTMAPASTDVVGAT